MEIEASMWDRGTIMERNKLQGLVPAQEVTAFRSPSPAVTVSADQTLPDMSIHNPAPNASPSAVVSPSYREFSISW